MLLVGSILEISKENVKLDSVVHASIEYEKISKDLSFPNMKNKNIHMNKNLIKIDDGYTEGSVEKGSIQASF